MKLLSIVIFLLLKVACCKLHTRSDHATIQVLEHSSVAAKLGSITSQKEVSILSQKKETSEPVLSASKARAILVFCAALYGSNYPLTKVLQDSLNPAFVTTLRFAIASLLFLPSTFRGLRGEPGLSRGSIELGIWCSIGFISQAMVLTQTSASKAAFFCGLSVLMPPIFELLEPLFSRGNSKQASGLKSNPLANTVKVMPQTSATSLARKFLKIPLIKPFLALCGAAILEWGSGMEPARLSDLALLITPISFAMCFWRSAQLGVRYPTEIASISGIMLSTVAVVGFAWSSISLNFCCSAVGGSDFPAECSKLFSALCEGKVIAGLIYSGIFTTAFTCYVEQQVIRVLSASETTLIYTLEPLFATAFAAFLLKEHVSKGTFFGAAFIISACLWDTVVDYLTVSI